MTSLAEIQAWFGTLIQQPLQPDASLAKTTPYGTLTCDEAAKFIAPSPTLLPHRRLELYHQQYWWRLLKCLQHNFPTLHRLFGTPLFQQRLAIPYLTENPPQHWALCKLGESFPQWIGDHYREEDAYLTLTSAAIDWAANFALWAPPLSKIDFLKYDSNAILTLPLKLQTHLSLFALEGDFFSFREAFLQHEPEHYNHAPFPEMNYGNKFFVLYRTPHNMVTWKEISSGEWHMLSYFKEGCTIEQACQLLEERGGKWLEEASTELPFWFKQWTVLEWFGQS